MTTIAWDGKTLAADRRLAADGIADGEITKIVKRKKDGALAGASGSASLAAGFQRWFLSGEKGQRPPLKIDSDYASAFIVRPSGLIIVHDHLGWHEMHSTRTAVGSGWKVALGAMAAGASAKVAVQIAAGIDEGTGSNIDTLELGK